MDEVQRLIWIERDDQIEKLKNCKFTKTVKEKMEAYILGLEFALEIINQEREKG